MLLAVHQLAVGLPQGSLQLVDAGLVLQQEVLRFIMELEVEENVWKRKNKTERRGHALAGRQHPFQQQYSHQHIRYA